MKSQTFAVCFILWFVMSMNFVIAGDDIGDSQDKWVIEGGIRYTLLTPGGKMGSVVDGNAKYSDLSQLGLDSDEGAIGLSLGGHYKRTRFLIWTTIQLLRFRDNV